MAAKSSLFFLNTNTSRHRIKLEPRYVEAQGPILSFMVPFVKIGVADWTLLHLHSHFLSNGMYLSYSFSYKNTAKHQTLNQIFVHNGVVNYNVL